MFAIFHCNTLQENFATILRKLKVDIIYELTESGESLYYVRLDNGEVKLMKDYLDNHLDKSEHEIIRKNIVTACQNYYNRYKAFIREILLDKNNPMCVKSYTTKTEFQGRGAGECSTLTVQYSNIHIHNTNYFIANPLLNH